jgi:hypothetical protein
MKTKTISLKIGKQQTSMILTRWEDGASVLLSQSETEGAAGSEPKRIIGFKGGRPIGSGIRNVPVARLYPTNPVSTAKE